MYLPAVPRVLNTSPWVVHIGSFSLTADPKSPIFINPLDDKKMLAPKKQRKQNDFRNYLT